MFLASTHPILPVMCVQMTLYVPGPVLRAGDNEVVLLEMEQPALKEAGACVCRLWLKGDGLCRRTGCLRGQWLAPPRLANVPPIPMFMPVLMPCFRLPALQWCWMTFLTSMAPVARRLPGRPLPLCRPTAGAACPRAGGYRTREGPLRLG